jgi:hypothetical protein
VPGCLGLGDAILGYVGDAAVVGEPHVLDVCGAELVAEMRVEERAGRVGDVRVCDVAEELPDAEAGAEARQRGIGGGEGEGEGVDAGDGAAHGGAAYDVDWDTDFLESFDQAEVGDAADSTATEDEGDGVAEEAAGETVEVGVGAEKGIGGEVWVLFQRGKLDVVVVAGDVLPLLEECKQSPLVNLGRY